MSMVGGLLVIVSLILFINVFIRLYKHLRKDDNMLAKTTAIRAITAIVLFLIGGIMLEDIYDNVEGEKQDESAEMDDVQEFDVTSESDIEKLIIDILGGTTNTGEKRVEGVVYNEVDTDPYIGLNLHSDENVTAKLTRSGMLRDTLKIMETLRDNGYAGKFYVDWRLPLTDKYGNTEPGKVMSINISAENFSKINFDNFDYLNLPDIADGYFEHPGFKE